MPDLKTGAPGNTLDSLGGGGKKIRFFEIIKPGLFATLFVWCVVLAAGAFLLSRRFYGGSDGGADSLALPVLSALGVVLIFGACVLCYVIHALRSVIRAESEIMEKVMGGAMVTVNDEFFTIKKCTDKFYKILGYEPGQIIARYRREFCRMLSGDESRREFDRLRSQIRKRGSGSAKCKVIRGDGSEMWISCHSFLAENRGGESVIYTVISDISEEMDLRRQYALSEARNKIVFENINSGIFEWNIMEGTLEFSDVLRQRIFGLDTESGISDRVVREYIAEEDYRQLLDKIDSVKEGNSDKIAMTLGLRNSDGTVTHSDMSLIAIRDHNHVAVRMVGILIDVEERHRREEELRSRASIDALTGLCNRGATQNLIVNTLSLRGNQEHAIILCDVDNFKSVNDTFGHGTGDEALKMIAALLSETFSRGSVVGRVGGDEFMVMCRNIGGDYRRLEMLLGELNRNHPAITEGGVRRDLTLSVGVALYPRDAETYEGLYKCADMALYQAKGEGKARYVIYRGKDNKNSKDKTE